MIMNIELYQEVAKNQDHQLLDETTTTDWGNQECDWDEIELK